MTRQADEQYSPEEAQRRFMAAIKAAMNTTPKPLKDKPRGVPAQSKKRRKSKRAA